MKSYLNFENDIKNLEVELDKLKDPYNKEGLSEVDTKRISEIQSEIDSKLKEVYSNLDSWQKSLNLNILKHILKGIRAAGKIKIPKLVKKHQVL